VPADSRFPDAPFYDPSADPGVSVASSREGRAGYGYIDVPSDWGIWYEQDSTEDLFQRFNTTGPTIITINVYPNTSLNAAQAVLNLGNNHAVDGQSDVSFSIVALDGFTAYQMSCHYLEDDVYLVIYMFNDDDGTAHYIAVEGPSRMIMQAVGIIENSYALER
jgi:hypothetical protein